METYIENVRGNEYFYLINLWFILCIMFLYLNFSEKKPWQQLLLFLYITFIAYALFTLLVLLLMRGMGTALANISYIKLLSLSVLSELFIFMLPALFWGYYYSAAPLRHNLCLQRPRMNSIFPFLFALMAIPAAYALSEINQVFIWNILSDNIRSLILNKEKQVADILKELFMADVWYRRALTLLALSAVPAFCEELFFRGVLQPLFFRITKKKLWAILITAFLFSLMHLQLLGFFPRLFLGIVLGVLLEQTGSLWAAIIFHALFNLLSSLILLIDGVGSLQDYLQAHTLSVTMLILGLLSFLVWILGLWKGKILQGYFAKHRL